jgi:diguanylate cyclase (GGDEF)-like protein
MRSTIYLIISCCLTLSFTTFANDRVIESLESAVDISGQWKYRVGDNAAWASPSYDDSAWPHILVPQNWGKSKLPSDVDYLWYRLNVKIDRTAVDQKYLHRLSVYIGHVMSAYEIYVNGHQLGGLGSPDDHLPECQHQTNYQIPYYVIDGTDELVIALRVWRKPFLFSGGLGGANHGRYLLATSEQLYLETFWDNMVPVVLASIYLLFGIYHLYLYRRNKEFPEYLWVGLFTISLSVYTVLISHVGDLLPINSALKVKIVYSLIFSLPIMGISFVTNLMRCTVNRFVKFYQYSFLVFIFLLLVDIELYDKSSLVFPWQVWLAPGIVVSLLYVIKLAINNNQEAKTLVIGLLIFSATIISDGLVVNGVIELPRLTSLGFLFVVIGMASSLSNRFILSHANLEDAVKERTQALQKMNAELDSMAHIDPLTNIYNRRSFEDTFDRLVNTKSKGERCYWLALLDIDNFKEINDSYGHNIGDLVLVTLANIIKQKLDKNELLGRWGGEEYILLLEQDNIKLAQIILESIRYDVETLVIESDIGPIKVTVSIGVIKYQHQSLSTSIKNADKALYQAKLDGKNKIEFFTAEQD